MKEMECSVSNLLSLTHWWNWQSSMAIELFERDASSPDLPRDTKVIVEVNFSLGTQLAISGAVGDGCSPTET